MTHSKVVRHCFHDKEALHVVRLCQAHVAKACDKAGIIVCRCRLMIFHQNQWALVVEAHWRFHAVAISMACLHVPFMPAA